MKDGNVICRAWNFVWRKCMSSETTNTSWVSWGVLGKQKSHMKNFWPRGPPLSLCPGRKAFPWDHISRRAKRREDTVLASHKAKSVPPPLWASHWRVRCRKPQWCLHAKVWWIDQHLIFTKCCKMCSLELNQFLSKCFVLLTLLLFVCIKMHLYSFMRSLQTAIYNTAFSFTSSLLPT